MARSRTTQMGHCYNYSPQAQYPKEPNHFSDDEPLVADTNMDVNATSSTLCLTVKAVPERPAVLASESVSEFPVLVGLKAPLVSNDAIRAPVDLVTVLDVSGSMGSANKLDLVKRAVEFVIDNLGSSDRLSIVAFSGAAHRILRLTRMTESGRESAKRAVSKLFATNSTNIVQGLKKGVQVLEERREKNPVASIIFLSDGADTDNRGTMTFPRSSGNEPQYLHLLPASIRPRNEALDDSQQQMFQVHAFGFGSDHDPVAMHAISDSSGGTFSFIESIEMVQDAFASCIGGLLSVVVQDLRLTARAASHGVAIKSIPSGRYASKITNNEFEGTINIGDMYAEEEREFLIYLSVPPKLLDTESDKKTSLLDVTCSYKSPVSEETVEIQVDLVEIQRPEILSREDTVVNMEVDRQRNRLLVSKSIEEAHKKAESKDLTGAQAVLSDVRSTLVQSASGKAGDSLCAWLEGEIMETEESMRNMKLYEESGRAYALAGMCAHAGQRGGTSARKQLAAGRPRALSGGMAARRAGAGVGYATRRMSAMVDKSKQATKKAKEGSKSTSSKKRKETLSSGMASRTGEGVVTRSGGGVVTRSMASRAAGGVVTRSMASMLDKSKQVNEKAKEGSKSTSSNKRRKT